MNPKNNITGIILAGGKSSRMGTDKGFLKLKGISFMQRIIETITPYVNDIMIISNNTDYDAFQLKRVEDIFKDSGPLSGLYTGLYHSKTENNLVLSCDVPLVNDLVLNTLFDGFDETSEVIQLKSQDRTMPLIALYKKECADQCFNLLKKGEKRLRILVSQLNSKTITLKPDLDIYVKNINTLEQYKDIEHAIEH